MILQLLLTECILCLLFALSGYMLNDVTDRGDNNIVDITLIVLIILWIISFLSIVVTAIIGIWIS